MNYFVEDNSCVVDIETLATTSRAAVISLAALKFSPNATDFIPSEVHQLGSYNPNRDFDQFVCNINPLENIKYNREFSAGTIKFWSDRKDQLDLMTSSYPSYEANTAFIRLMEFLTPDDDLKIWANPPRFDLGILGTYFNETNVPLWQHWRERCFRTVKGAAFIRDDNRVKEIKEYYEANGGLHDPLVDCKAQAGILQLMNLAFQELFNK